MRTSMRALERRRNRPEHEAPRSWTVRLMWFVALWAGSIAVLGVIAYGIRMWLGLG